MKEELEKVLETNALTTDVATQYLSLYLGKDKEYWGRQIGVLWKRVRNKTRDEEQAKQLYRSIICCAILIRAYHRTVPLDDQHPESLLFGVEKYHQFKERDWFDALKKVIKRDVEIHKFRDQVLQLGVIDPLEYQPYCRQAYHWLIEQAEKDGSLKENKEAIDKSMRNIVYRYGGMVVSNVFSRHREVLDKVVNWKTGYFIERMIFNVYTPQQILKIKKAEIQDTPPRLIKKIR